jgi:hypothetical protein
MARTLPLDEMSLEEKFEAMESLWDDLCRTADEFPSPSWHGDVLDERRATLGTGGDSSEDWSAAKTEIRRKTS